MIKQVLRPVFLCLTRLNCLFLCLFLCYKLQKQQKYKKRDRKQQKFIDNDFI